MSEQAKNVVVKHVETSDQFYVDLSPLLESGETVASVTSVTCAGDSALTITSAAVIASPVTVRDYQGKSVTIAANTGVQFNLAGGTVTSDDAAQVLVTVVFTKSTGKTDAVDCPINVRGQAA
jgi:ABC-type Fe3+-hydroxamate transport system substrate-binding protein